MKKFVFFLKNKKIIFNNFWRERSKGVLLSLESVNLYGGVNKNYFQTGLQLKRKIKITSI